MAFSLWKTVEWILTKSTLNRCYKTFLPSCHHRQKKLTNLGSDAVAIITFYPKLFLANSITNKLKKLYQVVGLILPRYLIIFFLGREPWSSGYGWRLMFERSWVRIPAPNTGWNDIFSHWFVVKFVFDVCLKRPKINEKEAGCAHF